MTPKRVCIGYACPEQQDTENLEKFLSGVTLQTITSEVDKGMLRVTSPSGRLDSFKSRNWAQRGIWNTQKWDV
jgi:hypothetical protein